jgi:hypothetical protein
LAHAPLVGLIRAATSYSKDVQSELNISLDNKIAEDHAERHASDDETAVD